MSEPSPTQLQALAAQLACPQGEQGIRTGETMSTSNRRMTLTCLDNLPLSPTDSLLEIGPGNGQHVASLLAQVPGLTYHGADISATMVTEANRLNAAAVATGHARFWLTDGQHLPFAAGFFSKIFTVNTLYFWPAPLAYLAEIRRVLRPGGQFNLCFAEKQFMQNLPFTQFGFQLYDSAEAGQLLRQAGFALQREVRQTEQVISKSGEEVEREFVVLCALKS